MTLAGDEQSGKTAFCKTALGLEPDRFHRATLDETYECEVAVQGRPYLVKLLDTSGNYEYRGMIEYDVKTSDGVLLFMHNEFRASFVSLDEYVDCIRAALTEIDIPIILVGNVRAGSADRIPRDQVDAFCAKHGCTYAEVDCLHDREAALEVLRQMVARAKRLKLN